MQGYYAKLLDRFIPPRGEARLRLGRRNDEDRRLMDDRRTFFNEDFINSPDDKRNEPADRRNQSERRQRWARMSKWRSRPA